MNSGCLFTISAPSGAGKTSLVKALLERKLVDAEVSVSHATRERRPGEADGKDYHFVSVEKFEEMVEQDMFLEHACVFGNYYGTSRQAVDKLLAQGKQVILEIDWQGASQVKQKNPETVSIFILPPSKQELMTRLTDRKTDDAAVIDKRMAEAEKEMSHYNDAEYLVINDNFERALFEMESIILAQSLKLEPQKLKNEALIASIL